MKNVLEWRVLTASRADKTEKRVVFCFILSPPGSYFCTVNLTVQSRVKKWHALITLSVSSICTNMSLRVVTLPPGVFEAEEVTQVYNRGGWSHSSLSSCHETSRRFLRYGNSFPSTFPEVLLAHASQMTGQLSQSMQIRRARDSINAMLATIISESFTSPWIRDGFSV